MQQNPVQPPFQAFLLAGGKSSRLGVDKAFLEDEMGMPLYLLQRQRLLMLSPKRLLLSGRMGTKYEWPAEDILYDSTLGNGPLAAIEAVSRGGSDSLPTLVLAVDLPFMTIPWLRKILEMSILHVPSVDSIGIVSTIEGQLEPLVALYPPSVIHLAAKRFGEGERAVHHVLREAIRLGLMMTMEVPPYGWGAFKNLNTPEDVASWQGARY